VFVSSIVCAMLPRFELAVAAGGRAALLRARRAGPEPGREQLVGEVSQAAEAFGIHPGMRLGEALARCPRLALVPPDPVGVADDWERVVARLEAIGAAVEAGPPGPGVLRRARPAAAARRLARRHRRRGARARCGARRASARGRRASARWRPRPARSRRAAIVPARPSSRASRSALLRFRDETAALPRCSTASVCARSASSRPLARACATASARPGCSRTTSPGAADTPLRPRRPPETLEEALELEESASGGAARPRARAARRIACSPAASATGARCGAVVLSATLVEGGTWRERVVFREPLADAAGCARARPAPGAAARSGRGAALARRALRPPHARGRALFDDGTAARRARLREAIRQVRAVAGPEGALRVLAVDPDSRVPERRAVLTPFEL
jgi:protein ImuB